MSILIGVACQHFGCLASDGLEVDINGHVVSENTEKILQVHSTLAIGATGNRQIASAALTAARFKASETFGRLRFDECVDAACRAVTLLSKHPHKVKISPETQIMILGVDTNQKFQIQAITVEENFQLKSTLLNQATGHSPVLIAPPPDIPHHSVYQEIAAIQNLVRRSNEPAVENEILDRVRQVVHSTAEMSRYVNNRCHLIHLKTTLDL